MVASGNTMNREPNGYYLARPSYGTVTPADPASHCSHSRPTSYFPKCVTARRVQEEYGRAPVGGINSVGDVHHHNIKFAQWRTEMIFYVWPPESVETSFHEHLQHRLRSSYKISSKEYNIIQALVLGTYTKLTKQFICIFVQFKFGVFDKYRVRIEKISTISKNNYFFVS